jgi:thiamine biosynthesis lipoprotein
LTGPAVRPKTSRQRAAYAPIWILFAICAAEGAAQDEVPVERHAYLMGTEVSIQVWAEERRQGMLQSEAMLEELCRAEDRLTTWRTDGALGRLNRIPVGAEAVLDKELCQLVGRLRHWWMLTGGSFDPLVGRLMEAWDLRGSGRIPAPSDRHQALLRSGFVRVSFDADRCAVTRHADVLWDSGGFGKGAALDWLLDSSSAKNWNSWLVDLGGQIALFSSPHRPLRLQIPIADPRDRALPVASVTLDSGSLAVSGGSEKDLWVDGERVGHILDPETGFPAPAAGSVVVWSQSALDADVASTALYVMGREAGVEWAERRNLAACFAGPGGTPVWTCSQAFIERFGIPRPAVPN